MVYPISYPISVIDAFHSAIFAEINELYASSTITSFVNDSKNLRIDAVVESVVDVLVIAKVNEAVVNSVAKLVTLIVAGTVTKVGINDAEIPVLANAIKELVYSFEEVVVVDRQLARGLGDIGFV